MTCTMKASARFLLSATAGLSLAAFAVISTFVAVSPAVPAAALGLLAIYGIIEMMIHSYAPRRLALRPAHLRVIASQRVSVPGPALAEFPANGSRARAA
jgi:hypothetical protein